MPEPEYLTLRSQELACQLEACTKSPEDVERIRLTGEILPTGSLSFKETRKKLRWVLELSPERYLTIKRVTQAIELLLAKEHVALPEFPGFSRQQWVQDQAKKVSKILQRARKSIAMDPADLETQPWPEDGLAFLEGTSAWS